LLKAGLQAAVNPRAASCDGVRDRIATPRVAELGHPRNAGEAFDDPSHKVGRNRSGRRINDVEWGRPIRSNGRHDREWQPTHLAVRKGKQPVQSPQERWYVRP
jgi:hypothetical protein